MAFFLGIGIGNEDIVASAQSMECPCQIGAEIVEVAAAEIFAEDADTCVVIAVSLGCIAAGQRAEFFAAFVVGVGEFACQFPIIVELVLHFTEYIGFVEFSFIPSCRKERVARQMQIFSVF